MDKEIFSYFKVREVKLTLIGLNQRLDTTLTKVAWAKVTPY